MFLSFRLRRFEFILFSFVIICFLVVVVFSFFVVIWVLFVSVPGQTYSLRELWSDYFVKHAYGMMSSGGNTDAAFDPNSLEKHQIDATQVYPSNYYSSTTGYEGSHWITQRTDNTSAENSVPSNSAYQYDQPTGPQSVNVQAGSTTASIASASSGQASAPQEYSAYQPYPNSTDPYGYSSTGYPGYYNNYQQQPSQSYSQPVGAYPNSGAPYQPISSFQNTGSYAGPPSYSSTYYNPGGYQTHGGYQSSSYSTQTNTWSGGNYANYAHQQTSYTPDSNVAYSSATAPATSQQYHQQWADYYSQTEVTCAPGTENLSASATSNLACPVPGVSSGYPTLNAQAHPPYDPSSWRSESSIPADTTSLQPASVSNIAQDNYWTHGTPSYQGHHVNPQPNYEKSFDTTSSYNSFQEPLNTGPNLQYSSGQHFITQTYQPSSQIFASADNRGVSKVQIQTNPRIASNLPLGLSKTDKENTVTTATTKPAYISVSIPNPMQKTSSYNVADSVPKTDVFPKSLLGYVERALARCKDDNQRAASQTVLKEMITRATADGTLNTLDWDIQPLFSLPDVDIVSEDTLRTNLIPSFTKPKRSPTRRSKSRWEPMPEEKSVDKPQTVSSEIFKFGGWLHTSDKDRKLPSVKFGGKENGSSNLKFTPEKKPTNKNVHRPFKKQRFGIESDAANKGDGSSDSDKEQSLTAYYSGAIALSNSPEERKRRESRSKRFEKGHGQRTEINHFRSKTAGPGNLYTKRASASLLSKTFEDSSSRAVEDIDWDALTVKGTCQEIEKRYLRLTSAPDPTTVRPEEVLEMALNMVQNSQRNYLYKCDQLKSIRQDLTVQRIRNHLTVKVYETHGRLALEAGDLPEYNQCQSQLKTLYAEGIEGCHMEFSAYNLLCVIIHPNKHRELVSSMSRLSFETKKDKAVQHALAVRAAVTSGNYVNFFRLYKTAPYLHTCLMDLYVEKMRYEAVKCMTRSYRPTVSVMHIAQVLGFTGVPSVLEGDEKDTDGLDECVEWLKAHGGFLVADNNGEMQLDTKASSTSLYMPEPEDAVAHGDANLAVNDFFTRTTT